MPFRPQDIRRQFPLLSRAIGQSKVVYLDTAATAQKPQCVIDAMVRFYAYSNANVHRGIHPLAEEATIEYEEARSAVAAFLGARFPYEVIFTRNATEAINLVARSWGDAQIRSTDTILLTAMEHHSAIVPWLQLRARHGCRVSWVSVDAAGTIDLDAYEAILRQQSVKIVCVTGLSNVLGCLVPLQELATIAHRHGALLLADAAQLVPHAPIDVRILDCDFLVCSGHKLFGPMGIGALYAKRELLEAMQPFLGGGDMIASVTEEGFTPAELPRKFEAGTPSVADAVGLRAAIAWLEALDRPAVERHESALLSRARRRLIDIKGCSVLGPSSPAGCLSFTIDGVHPHDLTDLLGREGICLRAGHHCCQPLHRSLGLAATTRLSVGPYTTEEEIDSCMASLERVATFLQ